jgi:hypothetical protein
MNTMEERYQKELFGEFEKPKRPFSKTDNIVPKTKFSLALSLEKTVIVVIAIVMAMVAVYALGIERGKVVKRESARPQALKPVKAPVAPAQSAAISVPAPQTAAPKAAIAAPAQAQYQAPVAGQPAVQAAAQAKPYTVVVLTFTRKDWAEKEIERMKKSGHDAGIYQSSNYFLVCVGAYPNKEAAKEALSKLKNTYKDAYLRSR